MANQSPDPWAQATENEAAFGALNLTAETGIKIETSADADELRRQVRSQIPTGTCFIFVNQFAGIGRL